MAEAPSALDIIGADSSVSARGDSTTYRDNNDGPESFIFRSKQKPRQMRTLLGTCMP